MSMINNIRDFIIEYKDSLIRSRAAVKQGSVLFRPSDPRIEFLTELAEGMGDNMTFEELTAKLRLLENTKVVVPTKDGAKTEMSLIDYLVNIRKSTVTRQLDPLDTSSTVDSNTFVIDQSNDHFLETILDVYLGIHDLYIKAHASQRRVDYTQEEIAQSPHLTERMRTLKGYNQGEALRDFGRGFHLDENAMANSDDRSEYKSINNVSSDKKAEAYHRAITKFANGNEQAVHLIERISQGIYHDSLMTVCDRLAIHQGRDFEYSSSRGSLTWTRDEQGRLCADINVVARQVRDKRTGQLYCLDTDDATLMKLINDELKVRTADYQVLDEKSFEYSVKKDKPAVGVRSGERVKDLEQVMDKQLTERQSGNKRDVLTPLIAVKARLTLVPEGDRLIPTFTSFSVTTSADELVLGNKNKRTVTYTPTELNQASMFKELHEDMQFKMKRMEEKDKVSMAKGSEGTTAQQFSAQQPLTTDTLRTQFIERGGEVMIYYGAINEFTKQCQVYFAGEKPFPPNPGEAEVIYTPHHMIQRGDWRNENGKMIFEGQINIYSLTSSKGDIYIIDPKTFELRKAQEDECLKLDKRDYSNLVPMATIKPIVRLTTPMSIPVPILTGYSVTMNSRDVALRNEPLISGPSSTSVSQVSRPGVSPSP
jgi:hypothetical protein